MNEETTITTFNKEVSHTWELESSLGDYVSNNPLTFNCVLVRVRVHLVTITYAILCIQHLDNCTTDGDGDDS